MCCFVFEAASSLVSPYLVWHAALFALYLHTTIMNVLQDAAQAAISVVTRSDVVARTAARSSGVTRSSGITRSSVVRARAHRFTATTDLPIVHFEDSAELQQLVGETGSIGGESRFQWEESVRLRLDRTDRMMTEMHTMLQSMTARTAHMLPPVDVNSPPVASATVSAPPAMDGAAAGVSTAVLQQPDTATASAPWPTADTTGTGICTGFSLPTVVGARASSFASSSLPMYAHVSPQTAHKDMGRGVC